jgi:hypothetical protein
MITILRSELPNQFQNRYFALFRGDSGYRIEKVNSQIGMPISQRDENDPERNN